MYIANKEESENQEETKIIRERMTRNKLAWNTIPPGYSPGGDVGEWRGRHDAEANDVDVRIVVAKRSQVIEIILKETFLKKKEDTVSIFIINQTKCAYTVDVTWHTSTVYKNLNIYRMRLKVCAPVFLILKYKTNEGPTAGWRVSLLDRLMYKVTK